MLKQHGDFESIYELLLHVTTVEGLVAETPRHGDIVADTENVLQTVFVHR